jgi:hypothetical protein
MTLHRKRALKEEGLTYPAALRRGAIMRMKKLIMSLPGSNAVCSPAPKPHSGSKSQLVAGLFLSEGTATPLLPSAATKTYADVGATPASAIGCYHAEPFPTQGFRDYCPR